MLAKALQELAFQPILIAQSKKHFYQAKFNKTALFGWFVESRIRVKLLIRKDDMLRTALP